MQCACIQFSINLGPCLIKSRSGCCCVQESEQKTEHSRAVQSVLLWCPVSAQRTLHLSRTRLLILPETHAGWSKKVARVDNSPCACLVYGRSLECMPTCSHHVFPNWYPVGLTSRCCCVFSIDSRQAHSSTHTKDTFFPPIICL